MPKKLKFDLDKLQQHTSQIQGRARQKGFLSPISLQIMTTPFKNAAGKTYELGDIEQFHMKSRNSNRRIIIDPLTRISYSIDSPLKFDIEKAIEIFVFLNSELKKLKGKQQQSQQSQQSQNQKQKERKRTDRTPLPMEGSGGGGRGNISVQRILRQHQQLLRQNQRRRREYEAANARYQKERLQDQRRLAAQEAAFWALIMN